MSVDPVLSYPPGRATAASDEPPRPRQAQSHSAVANPGVVPLSNAGTPSTTQKAAVKVTPAATEFPPDEVQLQLDTQIRDQVIIKYTDKATGEVVLQVPSAQVLDVARGIYDDFQKETKARSAEDSVTIASVGGKPHGH